MVSVSNFNKLYCYSMILKRVRNVVVIKNVPWMFPRCSAILCSTWEDVSELHHSVSLFPSCDGRQEKRGKDFWRIIISDKKGWGKPWLSWLSIVPGHWKVTGSIPGQGPCLGYGSYPGGGCVKEQVDVLLLHWCFSSLSLCLPTSALREYINCTVHPYKSIKNAI